MEAKCFVCGWTREVLDDIEANQVLTVHEDEVQHPNIYCPDCRRPVPTHDGKFPEHYRRVRPYRCRLVRCDRSNRNFDDNK